MTDTTGSRGSGEGQMDIIVRETTIEGDISGRHPVATPQVPQIITTGRTATNEDLLAVMAEGDAQPANTGTDTAYAIPADISAARAKKLGKKEGKTPTNKATTPDVAADQPDDLSDDPRLKELIDRMPEGYKAIGRIFLGMRFEIRDSLVKDGQFPANSDNFPPNWYPVISLQEIAQKLDNPTVQKLVRIIKSPRASQAKWDWADQELFAEVAHALLLFDRRFIENKFNDEFVELICDHIADGFPFDAIPEIISEKLGPDYKQETQSEYSPAQQRERRGTPEDRIVSEQSVPGTGENSEE